MVSKSREKVKPTHKMDTKRYIDKVKRAGELADKALKGYGEPTMSLSKLRNALNRQLRDTSLSNMILKDRET